MIVKAAEITGGEKGGESKQVVVTFRIPTGHEHHLCRWHTYRTVMSCIQRRPKMGIETIIIFMLITFIFGLIMGVILARPNHVH